MPNALNTVVSPQKAYLGRVNLTAATASTTRAPLPIATVTGAPTVYFPADPVLPTGADTKITKIGIRGTSTSMTAPTAAQSVLVWISNGTTVSLKDEISVTVVTPNATGTVSFYGERVYDDFVVPEGYALYMSTTVTTTAATTALEASVHGASF